MNYFDEEENFGVVKYSNESNSDIEITYLGVNLVVTSHQQFVEIWAQKSFVWIWCDYECDLEKLSNIGPGLIDCKNQFQQANCVHRWKKTDPLQESVHCIQQPQRSTSTTSLR